MLLSYYAIHKPMVALSSGDIEYPYPNNFEFGGA